MPVTHLDRALGIGGPRTPASAPLDAHTREILRKLAKISGLQTDRARADLVLMMRYHIDRGPKPNLPASLKPADQLANQLIIARAWDLVNHYATDLPAINDRTAPKP